MSPLHGVWDLQSYFIEFARTHPNLLFPAFDIQQRVRATAFSVAVVVVVVILHSIF